MKYLVIAAVCLFVAYSFPFNVTQAPSYNATQQPSFNYTQQPYSNFTWAPYNNYTWAPFNNFTQQPSNFTWAPFNNFTWAPSNNFTQQPSNFTWAPFNNFTQQPSNFTWAPYNNFTWAPFNNFTQPPSSNFTFQPMTTTTPNAKNMCSVCLQIVNVAIHHYNDKHPNEHQLKELLDKECRDLEKRDGPDAVRNCLTVINSHMNELYVDIVEKHMNNPYKICGDIRQC